MEFDILNELLTSSVAQLFTDNQGRHQSIHKNSTQMGQDKNIPRQGGSGMKDNQHLMQTPEKMGMGGMVGRGGPNDIMGGPSPTGERLSAILAGQGNPNQFDGMN